LNIDVTFKAFDVLEDKRLKEWLKFYSNWPTFPQVYVNQKFVGGAEIILSLIESNEFIDMIPAECIKTNSLERITKALHQSPIVVFIKGTIEIPRDGYSAKAIELLTEN